MRKHWVQIIPLVAVTILFVGCGERSAKSGSVGESAKPISSDHKAASGMNSVHSETQIETSAPMERQTKDQLATIIHELTGQNIAHGKTTWNGEGDPTETIFPDGSKILYSAGRPKESIDAGGLKTSFAYNLEGKLNEKVDSKGNIERFSYGPNGELVSEIDSDGRLVPLKNVQ